jgi:hypothetical protein
LVQNAPGFGEGNQRSKLVDLPFSSGIERIFHNLIDERSPPLDRRLAFPCEPLDQIPVIDFKQTGKLEKFSFFHTFERCVGKMPEDQIHLLDAAMPCAELELAPQMVKFSLREIIRHKGELALIFIWL